MTVRITDILAFGMPGGWEWLVILIIAVLLFGRRLPDIARSIGKSLTEFKKGVKDAQNDIEDTVEKDVSAGPSENKTGNS